MKLHLPVLLRKAIIACMLAVVTSFTQTISAATLTLGGDDSLSLDFADESTIPNLNNGSLQLSGDTTLQLSSCGEGDGKTYTLFTGVSSLLDAEGNPITLDDTNNAISLYFDITQPGSAFWADGTLQLNNGALLMVLHNETVKETITITSRQTNPSAYQHYASIAFEDISYTFVFSSYDGGGGAIYGDEDSTITLSNNGSVTFSGNTASGRADDSSGGAIYGDGVITLSNNGSVSFSGNTASSSSYGAFGGAVYAGGNLSIRNNDMVEFYQNAEVVNGNTYRLRSIYAGGSGEVISLSAAAGKSVKFYDSVYISSGSTVNLNQDYTYQAEDGTSVTIQQHGDIVFSGKYTEQHLNDLLESAGAGRSATRQEILNSRTTVVYAMTNLYGGRLCVEEGAIYQGQGITAMEGSAATVRVQNATLSHSGYDLTFNAGTTLELTGNNTIAGAVQMLGGSSLVFDNTHGNGTTDIIGSLGFGADVSLALGNQAYGSNEVLLYVSDAVFGWDAAHLMVQGNSYTADSFTWVDNLLILNYDESSFNRYFNGSANYNERLEGDAVRHHYESVLFTVETSSPQGGAIYSGENGVISLINNVGVSFSGNTVSASDDAFGGAIYGDEDSTIKLSNNGSVEFSGNTVSASDDAFGGAIYGDEDSTIKLSNNGSVEFSGNTASASDYYAYGGAIYGADDSSITLSNNGSVTFSGNSASNAGGAIYGEWGSTITLSNNGSVKFSGNIASNAGGAIWTLGGNLSIRNNDTVEFYQNAEVVNGSYRLRSIYADGYGDVSLSAAAGKSITFRDSIRIGSGSSFKLNESYEGKAQLGDIIFTGATTVDDLYTVKDNVAGTTEEIRLSRTSEVNALTELYGGRLRVEEGAIYQGRGITAMDGSAATVGVQNATLSHSGYDLTFNAGTTLELAGNNTIAGNVQMLGGSSLVFDNTHGNGTTDIIGSLGLSADVSLALGNQSYGSNEVLLYVSDAVSGWDAANLTVQGNSYTTDSFTWLDNLLVLNYDESSFNRYFNGSVNYNERLVGDVIRHHYESVSFTVETSSPQGGAIYGAGSGVISLSNNGSVTFSGNTASSSDYSAYGGAIYGDVTMTGNGDVSFSGNTASSSSSDSYVYGGAIYGDVTMEGNGDVSFSGNTASSSSSSAARGGAIYGSVTMEGNGDVIFSENTASGRYAYGGAIYGDGDITLSNNGSVEFIGNTASSTDSSAYGGAIYGSVTMEGNGSVTFSGNTATATSSAARGGAIYTYGDLSIRNNESVEFYQNAEVSGNTYRLRSIYASGGALSAAAGKSITFRDSIYIGSSFKLNEVYEGTAQLGDIIFTGATTEDDLYTVKNNVAGTAEEILSSRTSEVQAMTYLYGGRLRVEEGVIYKGYGITAVEGSAATVRVQNATLSHSGYDLTFNAGTTLDLAGTNSITGNVQMLDGSTLVIDRIGPMGMNTLTGSLSFAGDAHILLGNGIDGTKSNLIILFLSGPLSGWDEDKLTIQNASINSTDIRWINDDLFVLNYNAETFNLHFRGDRSFTTYGSSSLKYYNSVSITNPTYSHRGGAIYGPITVSDNGSVEFSGNRVSNAGGAIYGNTITVSDNDRVVFSGNTALDYGGAIFGSNESTVSLCDNGSVEFIGNKAFMGGAMYVGDSTFMLCNNERLIFHGNTTTYSGGAIFTCGDLNIRNNGSVEFYQNVQTDAGSYLLRSIHASEGAVSLSAAAGKSITFRDSIYIGSVSSFKLNEVYEGTAQQGDIIFTGATTVDDLYTVKNNVAGTAEEIRLSRTSEVNTLTALYGGRLRVEEDAIYQGRGITAHAGSAATVRVQNAILSHRGYELTFNAGTTLELAGNNTITGNVQMLEGSSLVFDLNQYQGMTTHSGSWNVADGSLVCVDLDSSGWTGESGETKTIALLKTDAEHSTSQFDLSISPLIGNWGYSGLQWVDGTLSIAFKNGATDAEWTNATGDFRWNNESYNWTDSGFSFARVEGADITFGKSAEGSILLDGQMEVGKMTVSAEAAYTLNFAEGANLTIQKGLVLENGAALTLHGNLDAPVVNAAGVLVVNGCVDMNGALNLCSGSAITGHVSGAIGATLTNATIAGELNSSGEVSAAGGSIGSISGAATRVDLTDMAPIGSITMATTGDLVVSGTEIGAVNAAAGNKVANATLSNATIGSHLNVTNNMIATGDVTVEGDVTVGNNLAVNIGTLSVDNVTVDGTTTLTNGKVDVEGSFHSTTVILNNIDGVMAELKSDKGLILSGSDLDVIITGTGNETVKVADGGMSLADGATVTNMGGISIAGGLTLNNATFTNEGAVSVTGMTEVTNDGKLTGASLTTDGLTADGAVVSIDGALNLTEDGLSVTNGAEVTAKDITYAGAVVVKDGGKLTADSVSGAISAVLTDASIKGELAMIGTDADVSAADGSIGRITGADDVTLVNQAEVKGCITMSGALEMTNASADSVSGATSAVLTDASIKGELAMIGTDADVTAADGSIGRITGADDVTLVNQAEVKGCITMSGALEMTNASAASVSGATGATLSNVTIAGELNSSGEVVSAGHLNVGGALTAASLQAASLEAGSLTLTGSGAGNVVTGALNVEGAVQSSAALSVGGAMSARQVSVEGALTAASLQAASLEAGSLTLTGSGAGNVVTGALNVEGAVQSSATLSVGGAMSARQVSVAGALTAASLQTEALEAASLKLTDGAAHNRIGSSVALAGAADVVGSLIIEGDLTAASLQTASLEAAELTLTDSSTTSQVTCAVQVSGQVQTAADLAVGGAMSAQQVSVGGSLTAASLQTDALEAGSLNLTDAAASSRIGSSVAMTGAVDAAGSLTVEGALTAATLQAKSLEAASLTLTDANAGNRIGGAATLAGAVNVDGALSVEGMLTAASVQTRDLEAGSLVLTAENIVNTVTGNLTADSVSLVAGSSLTVDGMLTANEVQMNGTALTLTAGSFGAAAMNFELDRAALESLGLAHGATAVIARTTASLTEEVAVTLNGTTDFVQAAAYEYKISAVGNTVQVLADYAHEGMKVWYRGAWVGDSSWADYHIAGYDAVDGVENVNLCNRSYSGDMLIVALEQGVHSAVITGAELEFANVDLGGGELVLGAGTTLTATEIYGPGETLSVLENAALHADAVQLGVLHLEYTDVSLKDASIGAITGTTGKLTIARNGKVTVNSDVELGSFLNEGYLNVGSHNLTVNALTDKGGNVTAGEVSVQCRASRMAEFDMLIADRVTVTNNVAGARYSDDIVLGDGSVVGELLADKLVVKGGTVTLGSTTAETVQNVHALELQNGATLILNQTFVELGEDFVASDGSSIQLEEGGNVLRGDLGVSSLEKALVLDATTLTGDELPSTLSNARMTAYGDDAARYDGLLLDSAVVNEGSGTFSVNNSGNALVEIEACRGDVLVYNVPTHALRKLDIADGKTVSAYSAGTAHAAYEASVVLNGTARIGRSARLNANLVVKSGSSLNLAGSLTMGSSLELESGLTLGGVVFSSLQSAQSGAVIGLFNGVDELTLAGQKYSAISLSDGVLASVVFSNLENNGAHEYYFVYDSATRGEGELGICYNYNDNYVTPDEPEIPDTPVTPDKPEIPDTPVTPDEPEIPDTPVTPDEPEIPDTPVTPDEPEIPDTPVTPDEPEIPDTPVTPDEPEIPDTPVTPDEPEIPDTPVTPEEPEIPDTPVTPDEPEIPDTPVTPDEPEIPDTPVTPDEPEIPDTPVTPEEPESLKPFQPGDSALVGGEIDKNTEVILTEKGNVTLEGKVNAGAITVNSDKNITFKSNKKKPGSLTGDGDLTKKGKGTLTLNDGNSSWTGDTYLKAGTIKVKGATALGRGDVYVQGGVLNLGSKAIANDIVQSANAAIKSGKKFTGTYTLENGELQKGSTLNIAKTATLAGGTVNGTLSGTGKTEVTGNVKLGDKGKITTKALTLDEDATLTTSAKGLSSKATTLTIGENALFSLGGKMTVDSLKLNGGELKTTASKPAAMTVKNNMELTGATLTTNGKVTTNRLTLSESTMTIKGAKAQNLTVKQSLTLGSGSNLRLNGKLSAGSLTIRSGGTLTMSGSKPVTLKVKGALTLNSGSSIILDYDFVQGKTYKVLTFGSYSGSKDYYSIFGVDEDDCTITNTGKALTLTVTGKWNPQTQQKAVSAETPVVSAAKNNPVADALVQSNWGQLEASRAFVNAMANRSMAVQLGNGERAVWASAIGASSRHSSAGGHAGADTNVSGGAFGLETQVGRASLFGMALGNSWTRVSAHGFGSIEQDTTHLGLYGQTNWRSDVTADWSAAYGRSESESMGSDWSQKHLQLDGRVSYNHELNANTVLSPFAGVQYYASDSAGIGTTDTGSLQNLRAEIGVAASRRMGKFGVYGEIALHQDIARNNPVVDMSGTRSTGMNPGRTGLNFTVGTSYELSDKWSVNASYTGEFVENANAHSANVGATYKF